MLRLGRCRVEVAIRTLMMIDSLEMTDRDGAIRIRQLGWTVQPRERAVIRAGAAAGRLSCDERPLFRMGPGAKESRDRRVRSGMSGKKRLRTQGKAGGRSLPLYPSCSRWRPARRGDHSVICTTVLALRCVSSTSGCNFLLR